MIASTVSTPSLAVAWSSEELAKAEEHLKLDSRSSIPSRATPGMLPDGVKGYVYVAHTEPEWLLPLEQGFDSQEEQQLHRHVCFRDARVQTP